LSPVCCSKKFALVRTRVRFPLRLARTDRREPLCHFAEAPDLARIHFTVEPGAMTYPDSQRNVRPELSPCVVMDGLIETNDVVIRVTFFAWNDPIGDGLQCTHTFRQCSHPGSGCSTPCSCVPVNSSVNPIWRFCFCT